MATLSVAGFYDMHIHTGPSPFARIGDTTQIAQWCADAGMGGIVVKSHFEATIAKVYHARQAVPDIQIYAALTLNAGVGGVNPAAVDQALTQGAKVIWMPTIDAKRHKEVFGGAASFGALGAKSYGAFTRPRPSLSILNGGKLTEAARDVVKLVADADAVLGTGHLSREEIKALADYALGQGMKKLVVTHPEMEEVEVGPAARVLEQPEAEYTKEFLSSIPGRKLPRKTSAIGQPVIEVKGLRKTCKTQDGWFGGHRSVVVGDGLDLRLNQGQTVALVGESGCGKSSLARMILGLIKPDAGEIHVGGRHITSDRSSQRHLRSQVQAVFQDPYSSLDPRLTVGESILKGPSAFGVAKAEARRSMIEWLECVGLSEKAGTRYPHEFSGGQRQRICIARALIPKPKVLIANEAVSALDLSIQAQMLSLLEELKRDLGLSMLFIIRDLRVANDIADQIVAMKAGAIVESQISHDLFSSPRNPCTTELPKAVPGRSMTI